MHTILSNLHYIWNVDIAKLIKIKKTVALGKSKDNGRL